MKGNITWWDDENTPDHVRRCSILCLPRRFGWLKKSFSKRGSQEVCQSIFPSPCSTIQESSDSGWCSLEPGGRLIYGWKEKRSHKRDAVSVAWPYSVSRYLIDGKGEMNAQGLRGRILRPWPKHLVSDLERKMSMPVPWSALPFSLSPDLLLPSAVFGSTITPPR